LKGVKKVVTGFYRSEETDTVYYDSAVITIHKMEEALKKAGTYVRTINTAAPRNDKVN
jgi:copper chaperone CopZ